MPANKNAMTRYKILDQLLSNRYHNYSLDDLTDEVNIKLSEMYPGSDGVVRRTIEKDIYYLEYEGPFVVDIERYTVASYNPEKGKTFAKKCLRYANRSFSIFKKELTSDEEYLLREGLSLLGQFEGLPNLDALEGLRQGLGLGTNQRQIISFTKNTLQNSNIIGELFTYISQRQVIRISYKRFDISSDTLTIDIYPYLLKEYNHRWFLFCRAENGKKILCFSLDRIKNIETLPSHKYIDYDGDINNIFKDIIGVTIFDNSPIQHIIFWVSDTSKDYVRTKPLHNSQVELSDVSLIDNSVYNKLIGGAYFSIDCKFNYELERELSSYGENLVVISPTDIQDKIFQRISQMNNIYETLRT